VQTKEWRAMGELADAHRVADGCQRER